MIDAGQLGVPDRCTRGAQRGDHAARVLDRDRTVDVAVKDPGRNMGKPLCNPRRWIGHPGNQRGVQDRIHGSHAFGDESANNEQTGESLRMMVSEIPGSVASYRNAGQRDSRLVTTKLHDGPVQRRDGNSPADLLPSWRSIGGTLRKNRERGKPFRMPANGGRKPLGGLADPVAAVTAGPMQIENYRPCGCRRPIRWHKDPIAIFGSINLHQAIKKAPVEAGRQGGIRSRRQYQAKCIAPESHQTPADTLNPLTYSCSTLPPLMKMYMARG